MARKSLIARENKRQKMVARYAEKKKGFDLIHKIAAGLKEKKIDFKWKIIGENSKFLLKDEFFRSNANFFDLIEKYF